MASFLKGIGDKVQSATGLDKDKKELEAEREAHNVTKKELQNTKAALQKAELELSRSRQQITDLNNQLKAVTEELDGFKSTKKAEEEAALKKKQQEALAAMAAQQNEASAKTKATEDAAKIYEAGSGLLVDHDKLSSAIAPNKQAQIQLLKNVFLGNYGKDLTKYVTKSLSGNNRTFNLGLLETVTDYEAELLTEAMKGLTTDEAIIVEILCTSNNAELHAIADAYGKLNEGKSLTEKVQKCTSGALKQLLTVVLLGKRDEGTAVDAAQVAADAQTLWNANEAKMIGVDEAPFIAVFGNRSAAHLAALNAKYVELHPKNKDLFHCISKGFSGSMARALSNILQYNLNKAVIFADLLAEAFEGIGCDDYKVIRVVVRRREKDWSDIKKAYNAAHTDKDLVSRTIDELSGTLQKSVLAAVGEPVAW